MSLSTMKIWRLLVPGGIIFIYWTILLFIIAGVQQQIPDLSKAPYIAIVVVMAVIYYITPLRTWINRSSHARITENLRSGMVRISGYTDKPEVYTWANLRSLFFKIIDEDKSLSNKASLAYLNGLIWTSFADAGAIGLCYSAMCIVLIYLDIPNASIALIVFVTITVISLFGKHITAKHQIQIGNQQLEVIRFEHKAAIEKRLNELER